MKLTPEDLFNPAARSGFSRVSQRSTSKPYRMQVWVEHEQRRELRYGPWRSSAEQAAQDYCDWYNGQPLAQVEQALTGLKPRERKRVLRQASSKGAWPTAMRAAIIERDKVCQACGLDYPYPDVDHIDPEGPHSMENGQVLCPNCHRIKTREDDRRS